MGSMTFVRSSVEYPNSARSLSQPSTLRPTCLPDERDPRSRRFCSSQSRYG